MPTDPRSAPRSGRDKKKYHRATSDIEDSDASSSEDEPLPGVSPQTETPAVHLWSPESRRGVHSETSGSRDIASDDCGTFDPSMRASVVHPKEELQIVEEERKQLLKNAILRRNQFIRQQKEQKANVARGTNNK